MLLNWLKSTDFLGAEMQKLSSLKFNYVRGFFVVLIFALIKYIKNEKSIIAFGIIFNNFLPTKT